MKTKDARVSENLEDASPVVEGMPQEYNDLRRYFEGRDLNFDQTQQDWLIRQLLEPLEMQKIQELSKMKLNAMSGEPTQKQQMDRILNQILSEESAWPAKIRRAK